MLKVLKGIARHPLTRDRPIAALWRFFAWQIATRLVSGSIAVPFVGNTRLLVHRGMTGATGNVYCGLHEFEDMALVIHALRPGDLFVDIGANIGSYTILAAGACGSGTLTIEPVPRTFAALMDNVRLNDLGGRVHARNIGLGDSSGTLTFTDDLDTVNHVVAPGESVGSTITVPVLSLDELALNLSPALIKIDVEGLETSVIAGAQSTLQQPSLLAVLMELNGSGARYGFDDSALHERMCALGFTPAMYDPRKRLLQKRPSGGDGTGNIVFVRRWEELQSRLTEAPRYIVAGAAL